MGTKPSELSCLRTRVHPSPWSCSRTNISSPSPIATDPSFPAENRDLHHIKHINFLQYLQLNKYPTNQYFCQLIHFSIALCFWGHTSEASAHTFIRIESQCTYLSVHTFVKIESQCTYLHKDKVPDRFQWPGNPLHQNPPQDGQTLQRDPHPHHL